MIFFIFMLNNNIISCNMLNNNNIRSELVNIQQTTSFSILNFIAKDTETPYVVGEHGKKKNNIMSNVVGEHGEKNNNKKNNIMSNVVGEHGKKNNIMSKVKELVHVQNFLKTFPPNQKKMIYTYLLIIQRNPMWQTCNTTLSNIFEFAITHDRFYHLNKFLSTNINEICIKTPPKPIQNETMFGIRIFDWLNNLCDTFMNRFGELNKKYNFSFITKKERRYINHTLLLQKKIKIPIYKKQGQTIRIYDNYYYNIIQLINKVYCYEVNDSCCGRLISSWSDDIAVEGYLELDLSNIIHFNNLFGPCFKKETKEEFFAEDDLYIECDIEDDNSIKYVKETYSWKDNDNNVYDFNPLRTTWDNNLDDLVIPVSFGHSGPHLQLPPITFPLYTLNFEFKWGPNTNLILI